MSSQNPVFFSYLNSLKNVSNICFPTSDTTKPRHACVRERCTVNKPAGERRSSLPLPESSINDLGPPQRTTMECVLGEPPVHAV